MVNEQSNGEGGHEVKESAYNLRQSNILLIADLQREAFELLNKNNNPGASFQRWQSIRLIIENRFDDAERENLDKSEVEFYSPFKTKRPSNLQPYSMEKKNYDYYARRVLRTRLSKYVSKIMVLMRKYGLDLGDKEVKVRLS